MRTMLNAYPKGLLCAFLILFSITAFAQSTQQTTAKLKEADELYKNRKLKEAQEIYLQYADALSLDQQSTLGILYIYSDPANKDYTSAMQWFQKAAGKGHTKSMTLIAAMYMDGLGVPKDTVASFNWHKKAADLKDLDAMLMMGAMYQIGKNVKADEKQAIYWYKTAAENGNDKGYYYLGELYFSAKLYNTAVEWYRKGANSKNLAAMYKLALIYEQGTGVMKDLDEAASWYKMITTTQGYTNYHSKAYDKLSAIGGTIPSSDINTMKPILLRLASGATNNFSGLIGNNIPSNYDDKKSFTIISDITYYKSLLETGLKDVYIRKEVVKDIEAGGYRTKAGTYYSFNADIVFRVDQEKADMVYTEWVGLLKASFPSFQVSTSTEQGKAHYFTGYINGKEIIISLYSCCPARGEGDKMVSMTIKLRD